MSAKKRNMVLSVILVGAFISSLSQSMLSSALPSIMEEFGISATVGQWLTTVYILVLGIVASTTAYLINRYDLKKLFISAMLLFFVGCVISVFAPNFAILLTARVLQACGAGILTPLVQVVAIRIFPADQRGKAMGMVGLVIGFAPAIAPSLSGFFVDFFGWRSIFYLLLLISIFVIILAAFVLTDMGEKTKGRMDIISVLLYGLGFCSFMLGVTNQESHGWLNYHTLLPVIIGVICLGVFVFRQLKLPFPLLQLKAFKNRIFTISTILVIITYIEMMSGTIMVPILVQSVMGFSALISGFVLLPGSLLIAVLSPLTGHLFDKYGARLVFVSGMILLGAGDVAFALFEAGTPLMLVTAAFCLRMAGVSFLLMPLTTYGIGALDDENLPHGSAIATSLRQMSGALGSSILVAVMSAASADHMITDIGGVNVAFGVQALMAALGLIITFIYIKKRPSFK